MTGTEIFKDIIVPTFALIGVAQLWLVGLYRKVLKRPKLEVIRTGVVEISFSGVGPTICLLGTIVAFNKDSLISSIQLLLTRKKDGLIRRFKWFEFRPTNINLMDRGQSRPSLPFGFVASKDAPHFYNISFSDFETINRINLSLNKLQDLWHKLEDQKVLDVDAIIALREKAGRKTSLYENAEAQRIVKPFLSNAEYTKLYAEINELFYWEPGSYEIDFSIVTMKPKQQFKSRHRFTLTEQQTESLRLNVIHLVNHIPQSQLFLLPIEYYVAFAEYDEQ